MLLHECSVSLSNTFSLYIADFTLPAGCHTAIVGTNGSGKSALAAVLANQGKTQSGKRQIDGTVEWVSVEQQRALIEAEKQKDDADILDVIPKLSTVQEVIFDGIQATTAAQQTCFDEVCEALNMHALLDSEFLSLSTGETRKVLILRALLAAPEYLVLDEPWDGLDTQSAEALTALLLKRQSSTTLIFVINRLSELPSCINKLVLMKSGQIHWQSDGEYISEQDLQAVRQLMHLDIHAPNLPAKDKDRFAPEMQAGQTTLVKLKRGKVQYGERVIFSNLNWQVSKGEHWQVVGPNGSGKTCLLSMITGDNPHCYTNDLNVFGYQRGNGESIWDIKQHIGLISNSLHMQYRVNCSLLEVILSGFYDSIGLYEQPSGQQKELAREWLALIGLQQEAMSAFRTLSFGDQRMALIARAMVKHPTLLILDEPCNGLDDINRLKVLSLLSVIARAGESTLLYVNHHREDTIDGIGHILDMSEYQLNGKM